MSGGTSRLSAAVLSVYAEADAHVSRVAASAGIGCPPGCGRCCLNPAVTASVLELMPLAFALWERGEAEAMLDVLEGLDEGEGCCVLYRPDPADPARGRCSEYPLRPLLCRLFGWAARRGKHGEPETSICRVISETEPDAAKRALIAHQNGLDLPLFRDYTMRMAAIDPALGTAYLPINEALRRAIEYAWWKLPRDGAVASVS